ncbi:hypothetical protein MVG78_15645 [Roseomonas gilardii subsp. gilardii]|nr:hypothetical protein [Roseomonas gilardii]UPG71952.1 hypothetical protein MVG78_15645 [Roseomonas gilardii subsp. gilardii]
MRRPVLVLLALALATLPLAACQRPANDGTSPRGAYVGGSAGFNAR